MTESAFGPTNLPYGVFSVGDGPRRVGVRLHDDVVDVAALAVAQGRSDELWRAPDLGLLLEEGAERWRAERAWLLDEVAAGAVDAHLVPLSEVTLHLPIRVADYVDCYASEHHARNVGAIFRPDSPDLPAAWRHLPIGYHGRAGTVVVDGTPVTRPSGQRKAPGDASPTFGPSRRLDIEAELGLVVGGPTRIGERVPVGSAADHVLGVVLLNDWSARDIQAWEYVPLGPFLGKSFATSISAWVTPLDALAAARVPLPGQDPEPLDYLRGDEEHVHGLDIHVEVVLEGRVVARPEHRDMYWSWSQMLAHVTANGASLRAGDLIGSGTISGPTVETRGCLLELTWNGTEPLTLDDGSTRGFLEDGDTVTLRAWAPGPDGTRIGLGEVTGTVAPAV